MRVCIHTSRHFLPILTCVLLSVMIGHVQNCIFVCKKGYVQTGVWGDAAVSENILNVFFYSLTMMLKDLHEA
jgi:hypothetical protein